MPGFLTANDRPGEHAPSWYVETAGPMPDHPALSGEVSADVCVIGGGFAGLSAALHMAERGLSVVLLEANRVGWGASGRNGGQLGVGPRADIRKYEKTLGRDDARKIWDISIAANRLVRDLIARHGIDCDLTDGHLEAAWRKSDLPDMKAFADHVAQHYDHPGIEMVDKAGVAELIGTECYHGGAVDRLGAHLHPLRYALGLARAAAGAGAAIHEQSRVTAVEPGLVRTDAGSVRADQIVVACNGYLDGLVGAPARKILPLNNFVLATAPLGENRARRVNRDNLAVGDTLFVLNYWHLSPDRRIIWGGSESAAQHFPAPADLQSQVRARMLQIFPDLSDVEVTHAWGGTLAMTVPRFPVFQDLGKGIRSIGGWSGSGIHMATMGGRIAADAVAGERGDWDLLARLPTPAFPGGKWFRTPLLRLAFFWYELRDRL